MKKNRCISVILAILLVIAIISLSGCVKLQKKAPASTIDADQTASQEKTEDKKTENKDMSPVEQEVKNITKEIEEIEKAAEPAKEADEIKPENPETFDDGLPLKRVTEGDLVNFPNLKAVDPDGDPITYTFTAPLDAEGKWQTQEGDAGVYIITITASDGKNEVSQQVRIVVDTKNRPPVITLGTPKTITVDEGQTVKIDAKAIDPDNDPVTLTFSGWMTGPEKTTTYEDAGEYTVIITASDGKKETQEEIKIIVKNVNRAPKISSISDIVVKEGEEITLDVEAIDPDGDEVTIKFSAPLDSQGRWQTKQGDAGTYEAEITATDGTLEDKKKVKITVQSLNKPPVIELDSTTITVNEGEIVTINARITDPENDELTIRYSGWMTSSTYQTDYDDAGTHTVTITVSDKVNTVTQEVTIIVADVNRPPIFDPGAFN